jgi:hypothetical protein
MTPAVRAEMNEASAVAWLRFQRNLAVPVGCPDQAVALIHDSFRAGYMARAAAEIEQADVEPVCFCDCCAEAMSDDRCECGLHCGKACCLQAHD